MHTTSVQKYFLHVIKQVWAHKMQAKYETQKTQNVYWYLKRKLKLCNHAIFQSDKVNYNCAWEHNSNKSKKYFL